MSVGSSFMNQRGKVYPFQPMVARIHKGRVVLQGYPQKCHNPKRPLQMEHRKVFKYLAEAWSSLLTKYDRDGWCAYSGGLYSAYRKARQDVSKGAKNIIKNISSLYSSGFTAFCGCNLIAYHFSMDYPRLKPPFGYSPPTFPEGLDMDYNNETGLVTVRYKDPYIYLENSDGSIKKPSDAKVRLVLDILYYRHRRYGTRHYGPQTVNIVDIPSKGEISFDGFRGFRNDNYKFMRFKELEKNVTIRAQMDCAVAWRPDLAPRKSAGSEVAELVISKPMDVIWPKRKWGEK